MNKDFICAYCKKDSVMGWPDKEARKEAKELFPDEKIEDLHLVCGSCYEKIMIANNDYRFR